MIGKLTALAAPAELLVSAGAEDAQDPVELTNGQLDKVTGGAANLQMPTNAAVLVTGASGIIQFSPSTAIVTQINVVTGLNLFTVD